MMMSLDRKYNPQTLDDLAALVASTRSGTHPSWQIPGIKAALIQAANRDATISLGQLAHAALIVALDPNAKTPARISHDGPWWNVAKQGASDSASAHILPPTQDDCAICGMTEAAHHHLAAYGDHHYLAPHEHARQVAERQHPTQEKP